MEAIYLAALTDWFERPVAVAPSLSMIARHCRHWPVPHTPTGKRKPRGWPSINAVRSALLSLERKGYVRRNNQGRFEVL